jgi:hypothetical protein
LNARTLFVIGTLFAGAVNTSCGIDTAGPHDGYRALASADHTWTVWYLAPPWVLDMQTNETATLHVPGMENPGTVRALMNATMALTVDVGSDPLATALAAHASRAMIAGDTVITSARSVMFATAVGTEIVIGGPEHEVRIAGVTLASGRTLVLAFEATVPLSSNADVTDMIGLVETM